MGRSASFEGLLERLYASGVSPDGLPLFLRELARAFNAHGAELNFCDVEHRPHAADATGGVSNRRLDVYAVHVTGSQLWFEHGAGKLDGVNDGSESGVEAGVLANPLHTDSLHTTEAHAGMTLCLHVGGGIPLAAITINRDSRQSRYQTDDLRLARRLLPHLCNIHALQMRLGWIESLAGGFRAALDRLPTGAMLLDLHGKIVFSNQEATQLCAEHCGLIKRDHRATATWPANREPLRRMAERSAAGALLSTPETLMLRDSHGNPAATATATSLPQGTAAAWSESAVATLLFVRRLHPRAHLVAAALRPIFGFSAAEAELAILLGQGVTLAEAGARVGKSIATLRTQLRALFAKTGTHRQADLVQLLIASGSELGGF